MTFDLAAAFTEALEREPKPFNFEYPPGSGDVYTLPGEVNMARYHRIGARRLYIMDELGDEQAAKLEKSRFGPPVVDALWTAWAEHFMGDDDEGKDSTGSSG